MQQAASVRRTASENKFALTGSYGLDFLRSLILYLNSLVEAVSETRETPERCQRSICVAIIPSRTCPSWVKLDGQATSPFMSAMPPIATDSVCHIELSRSAIRRHR